MDFLAPARFTRGSALLLFALATATLFGHVSEAPAQTTASPQQGRGASAPAGPGFPVQPGQSFRDCPDCPEMVVIPAGRFLMGSPATEMGRYSNEGPQRWSCPYDPAR